MDPQSAFHFSSSTDRHFSTSSSVVLSSLTSSSTSDTLLLWPGMLLLVRKPVLLQPVGPVKSAVPRSSRTLKYHQSKIKFCFHLPSLYTGETCKVVIRPFSGHLGAPDGVVANIKDAVGYD